MTLNRNHLTLGLALGWIATAAIWAGCAGCAWTKTTDSTEAIGYQTAGETHVTYTVLPPDLIKDPNSPLYGKALAIPTVPGKDVTCKVYYENGQPLIDLNTRRSDVIGAQWAGANASDAAKLAHDQWVIENMQQTLFNMMDRVQSMMGQMQAAQQPASSQPALKEQLVQAIIEALKAQQSQPK